jgi:hypothetical protein
VFRRFARKWKTYLINILAISSIAWDWFAIGQFAYAITNKQAQRDSQFGIRPVSTINA